MSGTDDEEGSGGAQVDALSTLGELEEEDYGPAAAAGSQRGESSIRDLYPHASQWWIG